MERAGSKYVDTLAYNYDNSVVAYLTTDDTLYVIDSELTPVEIENDVLNMEVSYSGSSIAYTVGADYTATTLYVYNVKKIIPKNRYRCMRIQLSCFS